MSDSNSDRQYEVIRRFANAPIENAVELAAQIAAVEITSALTNDDHSWGELTLSVDAEIPPLSIAKGFPLQGSYVDDDGETVLVALFIGRDNKLSSLEYWKALPAEPVLAWPPNPASRVVLERH